MLSCEHESRTAKSNVDYKEEVAYDQSKDLEIQNYNLALKKKAALERFPCDTISVLEYILNNYPSGSYLLEFDRTTTYNVPKSALVYANDKNGYKFVFAVVATSRAGERLIEPTNIIGYDQSFIDLDSTELGTPFIYLVMFECKGEDLIKHWETLIPSHGGFNKITLKRWKYNGSYYLENNFHYAQGVGQINYNYFLNDNFKDFPHLLMTYEGTTFKRTLANINNDKYPDYFEHIFYNQKDKIYSNDSVAFIWNTKDTLYISTKNHKQTRRY
jgi:hypothetical protein